MVAVSAGHEYKSSTCDSGIVYCADYVLEISVVRGMRRDGGVCICLVRVGLGWSVLGVAGLDG